MKKTTVVLACFIIVVLGCFLLVYNALDKDSSIIKTISPRSETSADQQEIKDNLPSDREILSTISIRQEKFKELPQKQQDEMMEEFVKDFWEKELIISDETNAEEKSLSLEIFNRPYLLTLTEREFLQLSPEDQEKAMAEVGENCQEIRSFVLDVVAEIDSLLADKDYVKAEAHLLYVLEMGRELTINKEGMALTRLVGISCENRAWDGLIKLYTQTGDNSMIQIAREQMSENQKEIKEIAEMVQQSEAGN
jgi:hypothetical protein